MLRRLTIILVIAVVFLSSCSGKRESQLRTQADVVKFNKLFADNFHQSGYLGGIGGGQSSISSSIVYGRYAVKLIFDIKKQKGVYAKHSKARVLILEYTNQLNDGTPMPLASGIIGRLNEKQWASVNSVDDVFKLIDVVPKNNSPFPELATRPPESW
ncbi:MAG: hypothetical protein P1U89_06220 [Verrucomicrobiales bacterium]|nr:hypothetical protein [Verrucomicrobiales bacterium]